MKKRFVFVVALSLFSAGLGAKALNCVSEEGASRAVTVNAKSLVVNGKTYKHVYSGRSSSTYSDGSNSIFAISYGEAQKMVESGEAGKNSYAAAVPPGGAYMSTGEGLGQVSWICFPAEKESVGAVK